MIRSLWWRLNRPIRRLRHIAAWLPLLWRDFDWDHAFLFQIIAFKLRRMQRYHETLGISSDRFRTARQLQICAILLDRMSKNEYIDQDLQEYFSKYSPDLEVFERSLRSPSKQESQEIKFIFERERRMYAQDLDLFLTYFKKYHAKWWD